MQTITVSTKEEFEAAVNNNAERIIVTGDLAKRMIAAQKKKSAGKKIGIAGGVGLAAATVAGIVLAPVTAGTSLIATTAAATATIGVGAATITLTTAELAMVLTTVLGIAGFSTAIINTVAKNYNVTINAGNTTVECTKK